MGWLGSRTRPPSRWVLRPQESCTRFLLTAALATVSCHCCLTLPPVLLRTNSSSHNWATGSLCNLRYALSNSAAPH